MKLRLEKFILPLLSPLLLVCLLSPSWEQGPLLDEAKAALARAVHFFRTLAVKGSYVWAYSKDLQKRWGEGREATETEGWVQPPGTPSVGMAYLRAYEATGDKTYLDAAVETAHALCETQLASGGWDWFIDFHPEKRKNWFYRKDIEAGEKDAKGRRNLSIYDDDTTQSALRFLMKVDVTLNGRDREIRRAVEYGLAKLMEAQYPNGAWPQRYDGNPHDPSKHPIIPARYPDQWPRTHPGKGYRYWHLYTLNDRVMGRCVMTLLEAYRLYRNRKYLESAMKGGDFLILAQMPDPQPAWAQQYNFQMEPAWARRFEPPAIASAESADAVQTLIELYLATGDERYLRPVPKALDWFKRSRLPNGLWARFYELKTNRPLYITDQYELTYNPGKRMKGNYAFEDSFGIPKLFTLFEELKRKGREKLLVERNRKPTPQESARKAKELESKVKQIITSMDSQGRWVENDRINTRTFIRNLETLSDYIAAVRLSQGINK